MSETESLDPKARYGKAGERWGNVVLPAGRLAIDDLIRFSDEPDGGPIYRISRENAFPLDSGKRLYYYLRTTDNPNNS
jgi:hypothetical protein